MKDKLLPKLKTLNVVVASHIYASGPALDLETYLKYKVKKLLFIGHPFSYRSETSSFYRLYTGGVLKKHHKSFATKLPNIAFYLRDLVFTLWWVLIQKEKIDLFVGSDNFLAYIGLLLRHLGKVNDVILYTIDYVPNRFSNTILNALYHYFDRKCLEECKVVWNVSSRISSARREYSSINPKNTTKQIVVPLGVWYDRIVYTPFSKRKRHGIVFLGHLLEKQGVQIVIESLSEIKKRLPKVSLTIIGDGPYKKTLMGLCKKLKISRYVSFLGYIKDHRVIERELAKNSLSVATYKPTKDNFSYLADPGKVKNYLAAGLPVVITDVPQIARDVAAKHCGLICKYDRISVSKSILKILSSDMLTKKYSTNARAYAKYYDWNNIFSKALTMSL